EPTVVAAYIQGVLEFRGKPDAQLQGFVRDRDLNQFAFGRWRAFLAEEFKAWSPVYSPLAVLADIPEKEFAEKATAVIAALGQDATKPVNPVVLKALTTAKPQSFKAAVASAA